MARLVPRFRRRQAETPAEAPPPVAVPRRAAPPVSELRRERKALLRAHDERVRDLGGLVLEMFRRDEFRELTVFDRCAELLGIEERLRELDSLLDARRPPAARCDCGAPLFFGSQFCANCGRPVAGRPLVACTRCGVALAADARFCPSCGTASTFAAGPRTDTAASGTRER
jgi:hypothetical protein